MIEANHSVRGAFYSCSTIYVDLYSRKADALNAFDDVLRKYDLQLHWDEGLVLPDDWGSKTIRICDKADNPVGHAIFSWYKGPDNCYAVIGRIT